MKSTITILFSAILTIIAATTAAQPHFSAEMECGSMGSVTLINDRNDSSHYEDINKGQNTTTTTTTTTTTQTYKIKTKPDPKSPIPTKYAPSCRWFYFMASGIKDQTLDLTIDYNDSYRPLFSYDNRTFERFTQEQIPMLNGTITKHCEGDSIYIAYYEPYTLSRANSFNNTIARSTRLARFSIGKSSEGREMEMFAITNDMHEGLIPDHNGRLKPRRSDLRKQIIYIHSRIHPSESPASWHVEAIIKRLLTEECEMLNNAIFYILPIANPDGVAGGLSRSNSLGIDLEGNFDNPEETTATEVKNIKSFLTALHESRLTPTIALNLHAQSTPKMCYWIHTATSTNRRYHAKLMELASLTTLANRNAQMEDMSYSTLAPRYVEGWIRANFNGKTMAMTHELPYSFYKQNRDGEWVDRENIAEQGRSTLAAIALMAGIPSENYIALKETRGYEFKGELPRGDFAIYAPQKGGNWLKIDRITQHNSGKYTYKYRAAHKSEQPERVILVRVNNWIN